MFASRCVSLRLVALRCVAFAVGSASTGTKTGWVPGLPSEIWREGRSVTTLLAFPLNDPSQLLIEEDTMREVICLNCTFTPSFVRS